MTTIKPRVIQCESCGVNIETIRSTTKYCSDKCRLRARKIRANGRKNCKRCDEPIKGLQNVVYCSDDCKTKHRLSARVIRLVNNRCLCCGQYKIARRKLKYCSNSCRAKSKVEQSKEWYKTNSDRILEKLYDSRKKHNRKCQECGKFFETTREKAIFCDSKCGRKFSYRKKEVARRLKMMGNGKIDWSISIERLTKRDGDICYICEKRMEYQVHSNHDNYPSIEHIKPLARGGTHTWDNVKLAHRRCNYEKSDTWIE